MDQQRHLCDRRGRFTAASLCALVGFVSVPMTFHAFAQSTPQGTSVLSVRAGSACLKEQIRITGFAIAREESGASIPFDGYRISEILVAEGDSVSSGQELLRATRLGGDEIGAANPAAAAAASSSRPAGPSTLSARAPIAGKVTRINARVGMITGAASAAAAAPTAPGMPPEPMVRIMADSGIDLLVDVPSLYATKVRTGLAARIATDGGEDIRGTVRAPVSEVDPSTQLGRARLAVDPATALRPGQFASATIETARDCGLSVPRSAISYQNGMPTVQVLNGTAVETRNVRTGLYDETTIQIREGLSEGEPVVANAGTALRSGDRVTPVISDRKGEASR